MACPKRHRHHWTPKEDDLVRIHWGVRSIADIAKLLGRSPQAVYQRAGKLELGLGCPQGFEYLWRAAERVGVETRTLRRILWFSRVHIYRASCDPQSTNRRHVVEPHDVDDAVERWRQHETPAQAAARTGFDEHTIRRMVRAAIAGGDTRATEPSRGRHWMLPKAMVDELVAKRMRAESAAQACVRVGISYPTLHKWLKAAGIQHGQGVWLDPDLVDSVVASNQRAASLRREAARHGVSMTTLRRWLLSAGVALKPLEPEVVARVVAERMANPTPALRAAMNNSRRIQEREAA